MNLRLRSFYMIAAVLFLALGMNTAVLIFLAYDRGKQTAIANVTAYVEELSDEIGTPSAVGLTGENMAGLEKKLERIGKDATISYAMIMDTEGKILLHSNKEHIGNVLRDDVTLKALGSKGTLTQRWGDFCDVSLPLIDAEGKRALIVRAGVSSRGFKQELYNFLLVVIPVTFAGFLFFAGVIYFLVSRYVTKPITVMEKILRKMSAGDMTEHVALNGKDEIASLSEAINTMSTQVKNMIGHMNRLASIVSATAASISESPLSVLRIVDVQKKAFKEHKHHIETMNKSVVSIAMNSENLYKSCEEETHALEEITKSVSQIAESANTFYMNAMEAAASVEEMMSSIKETSRIIEVLSASAEESTVALKEVNATISEIQKNAKESVLLAEKVTLDASEKGLTSLNIAIQGMEDIKRSVHAIAVKINRLEKRSEEIGSILNVIDEVAAQTNLLSLNAAILAAQAGEHGKSFIVVADEIKRLAEKTSASTKEIAELIATVQAETQSSVEMASKGIVTVEKGAKLIKEVDNAFHGIIESSRDATEMSRSIQRATSEEANAIQQITGSIKQTTDQIDLISRATREQSRGSNIIVEASEKIRVGAEQLKSATESQARNIKQISYISENVSEQAKQIYVAMNHQTQMDTEVTYAIEKLQETTTELIAVATEMDNYINFLNNETKALVAEIQKIRI
jgi:methyl-accepting chemotaxis protein